MVRKVIYGGLFFLALLLVFVLFKKNDTRIKIGHGGGYLSAALYAAQDKYDADIQQFRSSSDIAYALLSGQLDAGFVEAEKLAAFAGIDGFDKLTVLGKVTYPYGATLILRKGLDVRLHELNGLTVAVSSPKCVLLHKFEEDASRLEADISGIMFKHVAFDGMVPALEAGVVDAAIIKGSYSVAALQANHSILYQNWEMQPGDECCPAVINQAELVLLARRNKSDAVKPFVDALLSAQRLPPDNLRRAVANNTVIPFEILLGQPVPEFSEADDELTLLFVRGTHEHGDEYHDDHDAESDEHE